MSRQFDKIAATTLPQGQWARLQEAASRPWIMSLEVDGAGVELLTEGAPEGRFRYQVGLIASSLEDDADPVIRAVKRGNQLEVGPTVLRVWRDHELLGDLSARAYIWWCQRALQGQFLGSVLASRRKASQPQGRGAGVERGASASPSAAWMAEFRAFLQRVGQHPSLSGAAVEGPQFHTGSGQAEFTVRAGREAIILRASPAGEGRAFFKAGAWAFSYPNEHPLDTAPRQTLARRFADAAIKVSAQR